MHISRTTIIRALLWILLVLMILEQFSTIKWVLDNMSTTTKVFPLQGFLALFQGLWNTIDLIFQSILSDFIFQIFFRFYVWGAATYALMIFLVLAAEDSNFEFIQLSDIEKKGYILTLVFGIVMLISIIYGANRTNWVPYVQEPTWEINLVHKQQLSAGNFMMFYMYILGSSRITQMRGHSGGRLFLSSYLANVLVFCAFMLDNLASFSWFPNGYEEIFQEGQDIYSPDKLFHFSVSAALALILLCYLRDRVILVISIAIGCAVFWEVFEIVLNPREISDSGLDMIINISGMIIVTIFRSKLINYSYITQIELVLE